jgi:hypothetical protein
MVTDRAKNENKSNKAADELVETKTSEISVKVVCRIRPVYDRNINMRNV